MQILDGRRYETRAELAARHGVTPRTLSSLWAERDHNDHPPARRIGRELHWDAEEYDQWLSQHWTPRPRRTPAPEVPDGLAGPAEFARICGHTDTSIISRWVEDPPPGFPDPDHLHPLPSGRHRPYWATDRMRQWARTHPPTPSGKPRKPHAYAGDARLDRARALLAEHPDIATSAAVQQLQADDDTATSPRSWTALVRTARRHPTA
ncbi:hypothetical protein [Streptomyces kronopolitis]|uniref:hypothetical protein n=1 Tax=Streptomyces kronopolitis TaxID=1612435 RepID=UPI003D96E2B3